MMCCGQLTPKQCRLNCPQLMSWRRQMVYSQYHGSESCKQPHDESAEPLFRQLWRSIEGHSKQRKAKGTLRQPWQRY